jgi:hypothetical protein
MPPLTRYFIKSGLVAFVAALALAALTLARGVLPVPPEVAVLRPVYLHLLMVGWVTQLIMGVAFWMFPKWTKAQPRGREALGWAAFTLLNIGLLLRVVGEPLMTLYPERGMGWMLVVSALLQLLAGYAFIVNIWGRVKER